MAGVVRSVRSRLGHTLESAADRSLFIRVQPPPANLGERRAVLRAIQRYGDVDMFKKLAVGPVWPANRVALPLSADGCLPACAQDSASFVSIASSASMAADLVRRSPLTVEFITDKFDTAQQPLAPASFTSPIQPIETSAAAAPATETRSGARVSHRSFVLGVFPADGYRHKTTIRQSPLHGPWPQAGGDKHTFVYNALRDVVPDGPGADALCDWQTGRQLSDEPRMERSQETRGRLAHIRDRLARRQRAARKDEAPVATEADQDTATAGDEASGNAPVA